MRALCACNPGKTLGQESGLPAGLARASKEDALMLYVTHWQADVDKLCSRLAALLGVPDAGALQRAVAAAWPFENQVRQQNVLDSQCTAGGPYLEALHHTGAAGCPCESQVSFADHPCQHRCASLWRTRWPPCTKREERSDFYTPSWSP